MFTLACTSVSFLSISYFFLSLICDCHVFCVSVVIKKMWCYLACKLQKINYTNCDCVLVLHFSVLVFHFNYSSTFVKYLAFSLHATFPSDKVTLLCIIWLVPARVNIPACLHFSFLVISLNFQARNSSQNQFLFVHNSGSSEFLYRFGFCFDLRVSLQVHCGVTCAPAWR